ncbi:MAG: DUF4388 domain-containing protein [Acidobacteria bacterium]|nr:DUF4388 domain-containing protein [Acidobacteriota bacterium]MBV9476080.1 DUF4388 domain-containing protein [Acidobacteriota bacterium]
MSDAVLSGSLTAFRLPAVLTFLSNTHATGTLTAANESNAARFYFADGALIFAGTNQESLRLGAILMRRRKITREQRDRIDALMQRDGGQFGSLAVREGVVTDEQLRDFLKVQVSEIVYDAFVWDRGTFSFTRDAELPAHAVTIAIDLPNLIMEGARRIEEWAQCVALLPDKDVVFRVVARPRDEKITLTADEWKILFLINAQRTLDDLARDSDEDAVAVYRVVYGLLSNHLIEPVNAPPPDDGTLPPSDAMLYDELPEDATVRQTTPRFGAESTVRDSPDDDTHLLLSTEERLSYADVVRPIVAQLTIEADAMNGARVIPLTEGDYLLGRHRDNTIELTDAGVSSFHARIYRGPDGYTIEDLKSRNGTFVNGSRVFHATLSDGDVVHVGQTDLVYRVLFSG